MESFCINFEEEKKNYIEEIEKLKFGIKYIFYLKIKK